MSQDHWERIYRTKNPTSLALARQRLGARAALVTWLAADVRAVPLSADGYAVWHDRAVFHFLTDATDRARYVAHLRQTLKVGGSAIIATFALDGPEECSGLPVARYSPETLASELGPQFRLMTWLPHVHTTPWGAAQSFQYSRFQRTTSPA